MPNIRDLREHFTKRYIQRSHNNPEAFKMGNAMGYIQKGIVEFWNGWMTEEEILVISQLETIASKLESRLSDSLRGAWEEGDLTYILTMYDKSELPKRTPRYELDQSVRIESGDVPTQTGFYLPDINFAPARFIPEDYGQPASARQGTQRSNWVDSEKGEKEYCWLESKWAKTGWTLIRRVEGEFIDVPSEGFFPKGLPEELYSWPEKETLIN